MNCHCYGTMRCVLCSPPTSDPVPLFATVIETGYRPPQPPQGTIVMKISMPLDVAYALIDPSVNDYDIVKALICDIKARASDLVKALKCEEENVF